MNIYIHKHIYTCTHIYIHKHTHTHIYIYIHKHTYTYKYNIYLHLHTHTYKHIYIHTYIINTCKTICNLFRESPHPDLASRSNQSVELQ